MKLSASVDLGTLFKVTTRSEWDFVTPLGISCLSVFGLAFIYSAELPVHGQDWIKQVIFLGIGAVLYVMVALIDYRRWIDLAHWIYLGAMAPLVLVLVPAVGHASGGSQRWINFGLFSYQPSETAKIAVLIITASILVRSRIGTVRQSLGVLGKLALAVGVPLLLILRQPDLKSAIVLPPMVFSMLYVSKLSGRFFAGALGAFLMIVGAVTVDTWRYIQFMEAHDYSYNSDKGKYEAHSLLPFVHDYQRNRILSFVNPEKYDPMGIGWNQRQSLISVGSGGVAGKGWTQGTQARLGYLPRSVAHNDFIFSVIAEEKGFLGSLTVLGLFAVVLFNGIRIAGLARDRLGMLLAIGVTVLFSVHVFVNIAMTIGLVPITGIPLPFISYGGSFVLSCCLLQGLVQSVYRFRRDFT